MPFNPQDIEDVDAALKAGSFKDSPLLTRKPNEKTVKLILLLAGGFRGHSIEDSERW